VTTEFEFAVNIALGLTLIGLVAASIRMLIGPTAADRIVSLDLVTVLMVAVTSLMALQQNNAAYLDLGLALGLVGFLATVAFARYLETNDLPPRNEVEKDRSMPDSGNPQDPVS